MPTRTEKITFQYFKAEKTPEMGSQRASERSRTLCAYMSFQEASQCIVAVSLPTSLWRMGQVHEMLVKHQKCRWYRSIGYRANSIETRRSKNKNWSLNHPGSSRLQITSFLSVGPEGITEDIWSLSGKHQNRNVGACLLFYFCRRGNKQQLL